MMEWITHIIVYIVGFLSGVKIAMIFVNRKLDLQRASYKPPNN